MHARSAALAGAAVCAALVPAAAPAAGTLSVSPSSIVFAATCVGKSSAPVTVTASNSGDKTVRVENVFVTGDEAEDFTIPQEPALPSDLDPGKSVSFAVAFAPRAAGTRSGRVIVESDVGHVEVELSGKGADRAIAVETRTLAFGEQRVGTRSERKTLVVRSTGPDALTLKAPGVTGSDFSVGGPTSTVVPSGGQTTMTVSFSPRARGTRRATLTIASDACNTPSLAIGLSGTGTAPELQLDPATVDMGAVPPGSSGGRVQVTLANEGTAPLEVTGVEIVGANAGEFSLDTPPAFPRTVAPGDALVLTTVFAPRQPGIRTATLRITSDDPSRPFLNAVLRGFGGIEASPSPAASPSPTAAPGTPSPTPRAAPRQVAARSAPADYLAVAVVVLAVGGVFAGLIVVGRRRREAP